jgi:hypothetical protein
VTGPSGRLAVLFLVALLGVLAAVGLVVADLAGPVALAAYVVAVAALLVAGAVRSRRASVRPAPKRCTCCDGDHAAPVRVV